MLDTDTIAQFLGVAPSWWRDAACRTPAVRQAIIDGRISFFPTRGQPTEPAKAICSGCSVRAECLDANIGEHHGIFGGLSERERQRLRRVANTAPPTRINHGTDAGYQAHRKNHSKPCDACSTAHSEGASRKRNEAAA